MNKRATERTLLLMTIGIVILLLCLENTVKSYAGYMHSGDEFEDIKKSRIEATEGLIESLKFDNQILTFDKKNNTWYYSLNEESLDAYNPDISYEADEGVSMVIENMEITDELISKNRSIRILAYNDTSYTEYSLKCTLLPIMEIESDGDITDEDTAVSMRLYDNRTDATIRVTTSTGTMHIRGGTSRSFPKTSFKLSLSKQTKMSLLGMRKDDDWILYSPYNDQEKVRNVFSTNLWKYSCANDNSLGVDNGNEYKYIELFLNGSYYGLYALGYPIDEKQLEISENEYLYKKLYWDSEIIADYSLTGEISGYEIKKGDDTDETWSPLREYYAIQYSDIQGTNDEIYESADIDTAIDIYLFFNLIQGVDNVNNAQMHNMYISAKEKAGRYVMLYTPWDMDQSWGNIWNDEMLNFCNTYGISTDTNVIMGSGCIDTLIGRGDEDIIDMIISRYNHLRENEWSDDYINQMIDEYEEDIYGSGAYLREQNRWKAGTYSNPEDGLSVFREYVMERLSYMDEYCKGLEINE